MRSRRILTAMLIVLASGVARADRGSIPFYGNVKIYEPNQRALIAWNGEEEILLLTTNLRASQPTKVLEVLPLPAEPVVKKGDIEIFRKATEFINQKLQQFAGRGKQTGVIAEQSAAEVTFHERIGAHDISVARVISDSGFVAWVNDYLGKLGVDNPMIPDTLKQVIQEYISDGYDWFVFDVVELSEEPRTNDAIQYRFKSDHLYYPLRITRTESDYTEIDLLILTPKLLRHFPGLAEWRVNLVHEPISISSQEVRNLSAEIDDFLENRDDLKLRIWHITGNLSSFDKDLIATYDE